MDGPTGGGEHTGSNFTALAQAAFAIHEMFVSMVEAGFTESQAMKMTAYIVTRGGDNDPQA